MRIAEDKDIHPGDRVFISLRQGNQRIRVPAVVKKRIQSMASVPSGEKKRKGLIVWECEVESSGDRYRTTNPQKISTAGD